MANICAVGKRKDSEVSEENFVLVEPPKRLRHFTVPIRRSARVAAIIDNNGIVGKTVTGAAHGVASPDNTVLSGAPNIGSMNASAIGEDCTIPNISEVAAMSPPVWANSRSALCDAVDYFRSHEGGNYNKDGITHGILLDATGSARDYTDAAVIITTM
jgi:hypothetical protein